MPVMNDVSLAPDDLDEIHFAAPTLNYRFKRRRKHRPGDCRGPIDHPAVTDNHHSGPRAKNAYFSP
jgi:hypothetical protein